MEVVGEAGDGQTAVELAQRTDGRGPHGHHDASGQRNRSHARIALMPRVR